jgi:hypothetical protein
MDKESITLVHPSKDHMRLMDLQTRVEDLESHVRCLIDSINMMSKSSKQIDMTKEFRKWEEPVVP